MSLSTTSTHFLRASSITTIALCIACVPVPTLAPDLADCLKQAQARAEARIELPPLSRTTRAIVVREHAQALDQLRREEEQKCLSR